MSLYFGETEMQGLHFGDTEITGLYFGDMGIWTAWSTYDGTLPATYTANGSVLGDYRIYGSAGGVGDDSGTAYGYEVDMEVKSKNIITSPQRGEWTSNGITLSCDGEGRYSVAGTPTGMTEFSFNIDSFYCPIPVNQGGTGIIALFNNFNAGIRVYVALYENGSFLNNINFSEINRVLPNYTIIGGHTIDQFKIVIQPGISISNGEFALMIVDDAIVPTEYQPHFNTTTTQIYIGSDPLEEDEYVDYEEGKIYRRPNLYDANATDISKGYLSAQYLYGDIIGSNQNWFISEYMPISASTDYIASGLVDKDALGIIATINIYNSNKQLEGYETINSSGNTEINSGVNGAFMRISARNEHKNTVVVKSKNALPTNPPVPLPQLPTVDGVNIVDYAGQSAATPSEFYAKYKKGDHST